VGKPQIHQAIVPRSFDRPKSITAKFLADLSQAARVFVVEWRRGLSPRSRAAITPATYCPCCLAAGAMPGTGCPSGPAMSRCRQSRRSPDGQYSQVREDLQRPARSAARQAIPPRARHARRRPDDGLGGEPLSAIRPRHPCCIRRRLSQHDLDAEAFDRALA